jgi:protease-4
MNSDFEKNDGNNVVPPANTKEWKLIEKTLLQMGVENRKSRRWGIFFKVLMFIYLFAVLFVFLGSDKNSLENAGPHVAVVDVKGVIADNEDANAKTIIKGLRASFKDPDTKAVILNVNSPGGSPVQAGYVYDEIKRLRKLHPDIKVYAVIADLGASGAYYIASAADEIYADKASLVGSIGVTASGFGFVDALKKIGVERRIFTSGKHKAFLDPFSPEKPDEVAFWHKVLDETHQQFIQKVREGRGDRLKETPNMFSGLIWNGEQAVKLGLIDGLGSEDYVAREVIGVKNLVDFTPKPNPFDRFTQKLGTELGNVISQRLFSELKLR